ncbi:protein FAM241B-like [Liolophura sinensis]|uniref:protein FAM241B-like n=1 Tax=Liolophura sinensis TaxID=3198878 RepID=UPI0031594333
MVKILSSGEIVQDDDPRAQGSRNRGNQRNDRPRQGFVQHNEQPQGMYQGGQTVSIFDSLNQRLLAAGIPRWNIGPYAVEPIVSVGFILAGLLMGIKGLLFAAVLFAVCQWSSQAGGQGFGQWFGGGHDGENTDTSSRRGPSGGPGGRGQRLGRS